MTWADLDIIFPSSFVFPLPLATQLPKLLFKYTSTLLTYQHWKIFQGFAKIWLAGKSFEWIFITIIIILFLRHFKRPYKILLYSALLFCPCESDWWFSQLSLLPPCMAEGTGVECIGTASLPSLAQQQVPGVHHHL